jgi:hypothetical protein
VERVSDKSVGEWTADFERVRAINAKLRGEPGTNGAVWRGGRGSERYTSRVLV